MASIQQDPSGNFHVCFRFRDSRFKRSLKTNIKREAEAAASRIEENIRLVGEGRMELPVGADIPVFLQSDGRLAAKPRVLKTITTGSLFERFTDSIPEGALESTSLATMKIHLRHITRILGDSLTLRALNKSHLQQYVTQRSREPGRQGTVSAATIRKVVSTFGSLWNWARSESFVESEYPRTGLMFPKATERPPFQTWEQITRQIRQCELTPDTAAQLWDRLYLSSSQLTKLLSFIEQYARHNCLHPMCALAAFTGSRRSEILSRPRGRRRSECLDVADSGTKTIQNTQNHSSSPDVQDASSGHGGLDIQKAKKQIPFSGGSSQSASS